MSASITQCPECSTRFKATTEQLAVHDGMVRCGRCSAVFKATEHLQEEEPNPQLSLPIAIEEETALINEHAVDVFDAAEIEALSTEAIAEEFETLADQILFQHESTPEEIAKPVPKQRRWLWITGMLLLLLVLLAQAIYFFRVEISAQLPGLKPALTSYCGILKCRIPLPKKTDLMSIESSDLEADPLQSNVITLSAILRNRANYAQSYPSLELSLTDTQEKIVARRIFMPAEYLKADEGEKSGLAGNREMSIKLRIDTTDLKPTGYKLFLFYPR